jgi:Ca2+-binding RTX toxin-like protein
MQTRILGAFSALACTGALLMVPSTTSAAAATPTCDGKLATIVVPAPPAGAWQSDPVVGTAGDDVIVGTDLPDTIDGAGGNDTICGLEGNDHLIGGSGDDRLFGGLDGAYFPDDDYFGDRIEPGPGDDHVDLGHDPQGQDLYDVDRGYWDQVSFRKATGPVVVDLAAGTATGEGTDTIAPIVHAAGIEGSPHDDVLSGTEGDDWIAAGGGDDVVHARGGHDLVDADRYSDESLRGGGTTPGDDVVDGGEGRDQLHGGHGADVIRGGRGRDTVWADEATGTVHGDEGRDYLAVGGSATIFGGKHADTLVPGVERGSHRMVVRGGPGRDVLGLDTSLTVLPHRSRLVVGDRRGTIRIPGKGPVVRFGSTEVFRPQSIASSVRLTWFGTGRADVLDMGMHDGPVRAYGRGGKDRLLGGFGNDLLDGGPGRDRVDGSDGRDRCLRAERVSQCERRR